MRTSIGRSAFAPTRRIVRVSIARRSFGCSDERHLADLVEEERPAVRLFEDPLPVATRRPLKAPLTCPKSSLSMRLSGMAPQSTPTNGSLARFDAAWMDRATTSLPVPVSPWMSSVVVVGAIRSRIA